MPIHTKKNGSWQTTSWHVKQNGSWERARVYLKVNGSWTAVSGLVVDDFEDGGRGGWNVPSSTGSDTVTTSGLDGTQYRWQHSGFREAHLGGSSAIDRGPQPGDVFEFWFRIESTSGDVINRFEFSADTHRDADCYRVEIERDTPDNELSLEKVSGGSTTKIDTDAGFTPSLDFPYRCEVRWNAGDTNISAQLFTPSGNAASNQLTISENSSAAGSDFHQPGIYIRTNGNNTCSWDQILITETV